MQHRRRTVAWPDPNDELPFTDTQAWTDQSHLDRRTDIDNATDWLLADAEFAPRIDAARIGITGHSLGGYAALAMVGAWESWRDPRFKAALLLSPFLERGTLTSQVHAPLCARAARWTKASRCTSRVPRAPYPADAYEGSNAPKHLAENQGDGHFYWTNTTCAASAAVQDCYADEPNAALVVDYGAAFLDRYLRGREEPLLEAGPDFAQYEFDAP